jgi:hypothetical protein
VECSDIERLSSRLQWTEVAFVRASDPVPHHDGVAFGNDIQDRHRQIGVRQPAPLIRHIRQQFEEHCGLSGYLRFVKSVPL